MDIKKFRRIKKDEDLFFNLLHHLILLPLAQLPKTFYTEHLHYVVFDR